MENKGAKISSCFVCIVLVVLQLHRATCLKSPCSTMTCPSYTNEISSSGNGTDDMNVTDDDIQPASKYSMEIQQELAAGGVKLLEITLMFSKCIPFDVNAIEGPKFYKLEAVSQTTGETVGEFLTPPYHTETELCSNNIIAFETNHPTVLDMPRNYRWKPTSIVTETVCFKATIHHYPDHTCETITKCLSSAEIPEPPEPDNKPDDSDNDDDLFSNVIFLPSISTITKCLKRWNCADPKYRTRTHCACNPNNNNKCKTFEKKCQIRQLECIYDTSLEITRGACPEPTTEAPTTPPTPPPPPPPVGWCKISASNPKLSCTSSGDFKLTQCRKFYPTDTEYTCYCTRYDRGDVLEYTKRKISSCDSPQTYNLNCIRY